MTVQWQWRIFSPTYLRDKILSSQCIFSALTEQVKDKNNTYVITIENIMKRMKIKNNFLIYLFWYAFWVIVSNTLCKRNFEDIFNRTKDISKSSRWVYHSSWWFGYITVIYQAMSLTVLYHSSSKLIPGLRQAQRLVLSW